MKKSILISILSIFTFVCAFGQLATPLTNTLSQTSFCAGNVVNLSYKIVSGTSPLTIMGSCKVELSVFGSGSYTVISTTLPTSTVSLPANSSTSLTPISGTIPLTVSSGVYRIRITFFTNGTTAIGGQSPSGVNIYTITVLNAPVSPTVTSNGSTTLCPSASVQLTSTGTGSLTWSNGQTTPTITVNAANNYYVTESNQCGTITSNTVTVTQIFLPAVSITGQTVACGSSTLHVNGSNYTNLVWNGGQTASTITTTTTGSFYAVASNTCGSVNSNTINVTINSKPTLSVSTTNSAIPLCVGQTATLTVSGADSYNWNPGFLTGDTVVVGPTSTTIYTVVGTNTLTGCSNATTITQNVSICTGVQNANEKSEIGKIYPIPATDVLNVELSNINDNSKMTVNIYSIQGKLVFNATYESSNKLTFDVSNFESGMYILEVVSENYKSAKNIVVVH